MNTLLRSIGLTAGRSGRPVVAGIDLRLVPGEMVALLGANGTGKSTLIRTLAGLLPPLAGRAGADEEAAILDPRERSRHIALVLTGRPRAGGILAQDLVGLGRLPWTGRFGEFTTRDHQIVHEAMERCGVDGLRTRRIDTLSDGECQQVMIARALAQATPVILLDEPTAHLDLANRVRVMHLLREVARNDRRAVVLSTHDLQLALDLCDRLLLIRRDRSHWQGTPPEAKASGVLAAEFDDARVRFDPVAGVFRAV